MIYTEKSSKSVQEIVDEIKNIASNYKFGVLHVHNVKETLNSKGIDFKNECQILDVCNPNIANQFLNEDMSLASIMPCKISVYTENGQTVIAMNSLVQLVDDINPDLVEIAQEAQASLFEIIDKVK